MKNAIRFISLLVFAALVVGLIKFTDRPQVRYSKYPCQFNLIYNQDGPVDLVMIGSSRSLQGVGADVLSKELGGLTVYNLAKNWRGQGINYAIMRDMIENREVKTVLVEANLPEGGTYHAHFFLVGRIADWFKSYSFQRGSGADFKMMGGISKKLIERITEQISLFVSGQLNPPQLNAERAPAETGFCRTREEAIRQGYLDEQKTRYFKYYVDQSWSWDMHEDKAAHDLGFYKEMVKLAEKENVSLVFYHINQAYYKTLDPEFAKIFEQEVGANLLIPPASLTREVEALGGYSDTTHMNAAGRDVYSAWLAGALKAMEP